MNEIITLNGYITDKKIITLTEEIIPTAAIKEIFDFEKYTVNRWRATWMNSNGTLQRRSQWKKERDEAAAASAEKRRL